MNLGTVIAIGIVVAGSRLMVALYRKWVKQPDEDEKTPVEPDSDLVKETLTQANSNIMSEERPDTLPRMKEILEAMGCQPEVNIESGLDVTYQGEHFHIEFGGYFAQVWDTAWLEFNKNDPECPLILRAINSANYNFGPSLVYTNPNEEGNIVIHSRLEMALPPEMNDLKDYVELMLKTFFNKKFDFYKFLQEEREEHKKNMETQDLFDKICDN